MLRASSNTPARPHFMHDPRLVVPKDKDATLRQARRGPTGLFLEPPWSCHSPFRPFTCISASSPPLLRLSCLPACPSTCQIL